MTKEKLLVFSGHIVECTDLDSQQSFLIEVMINTVLTRNDQQDAAIKAAKKHELVTLSGNSFDFGWVGDSGRRVQQIVIKETTELSPTATEWADQLYKPTEL